MLGIPAAPEASFTLAWPLESKAASVFVECSMHFSAGGQ